MVGGSTIRSQISNATKTGPQRTKDDGQLRHGYLPSRIEMRIAPGYGCRGRDLISLLTYS